MTNTTNMMNTKKMTNTTNNGNKKPSSSSVRPLVDLNIKISKS